MGGITIYESFELSLHPIRLQIDARVGRRIMEYLWPARKGRQSVTNEIVEQPTSTVALAKSPTGKSRISLDSPRALQSFKAAPSADKDALTTPLRRLGTSRSFTDIRATARDTLRLPTIHRMPSSELLDRASTPADLEEGRQRQVKEKGGDAFEMKNRASQKSFVLVRISRYYISH